MRCIHCQGKHTAAQQFCHNCGSCLACACPDCGFLNKSDAHYCGECGKSLTDISSTQRQRFVPAQIPLPENLADQIRHSQSSIEGERKQVTILFADIQGYTPLAERLGEEMVYQIMNRVYQRMLNAVHQHEGTVQELTGDGILALFGAPIAQEDAPVRACHAALEIQKQMHDLSAEIEAECGEHPHVRIGIHTGPVVVGTLGSDLRMEFKAVGDTVNMASRLESMAAPGTILISEMTHHLVDALVTSTFAGDHKLKGKAESQRCYRLLGMKDVSERFNASVQRGLTPLAGLDQELQKLKQRFLEAQQGTMHMVDIAGEAGSGKSRLLYEFRQSLQTEDVQIMQMHCSTYGRSTAFFPIVGMLKTMFHLHEHMAPQEMQTRIVEGLNKLGLTPAILPLLLNLLGIAVPDDSFRGLDAEIIGARTRDALKEIFKACYHNSTTIILIEDLHWLDSATETLLHSLITTGQAYASLVLTTYRPEYLPPWSGKQGVTRLDLSPLTGENSARLVRHCLGDFAKSEDLVQSVVRKVEGNPLFAEEMSRYFRDTASSAKANGMSTAYNEAIDGLLPESLRDIIMARIDQLEEQPRDLLQIMSAVGHECSSNLLQQLWTGSHELQGLVSTLKNTGLITESEQGIREKLTFKHALIQEAVYDSLLANRRSMLHGRVAQALETLYAKHPGEYAETLAYHWKKSTQPRKAIPFLAMAGEKSLGVYSLEEANQWFQQVLEQMQATPDHIDDTLLADVLLSWARVYYYRKDFRGLIQTLQTHLKRIESLGDQRRLSLTLFWLGFSHYFGARYDIARAMLDRALELGRQQDDNECIGYACLGLMFIDMNVESESSADSFKLLGDEVLAAATQLSDVYLESKYYLCMAIHNIYQGRFCDAENFCIRIRQLGERASDPRAIAMAHWSLGCVNLFQEQFEEAINNANASQMYSPDPLDQLMARTVKGISLALMGDHEQGLLVLQEVRWEMIDADYIAPLLGIDVSYGAAMALAGKMRPGVRWIQNTIKRFTDWGNLSQPAFGNLVLGEIYLQMALGKEKPPLSVVVRNLGFILSSMPFAARRARHYLEQAVNESRKINLPATLARALLDLARLNLMQKRNDAAQACLTEASTVAKLQAPALHAEITRVMHQLNAT